MNRSLGGALIGVSAIISLAAVGLIARGMKTEPGAERNKTRTGAEKRVPVIVELFTSEGCSSCPPADKVLADLQKEQPVANAEIIPLSEHVDYWNYIGWADPFSSHVFSDRQRAYGSLFRLDSVYTPQMVVDGRTELLGSDRNRAESVIKRAVSTPRANVELKTTSVGGAATNLHVQIKNVPAVPRGDTVDVMLAITEDHISSNVTRGENTGRTLAHTAVVRQLTRIGAAVPAQSFMASPALDIRNGWKRDDLNAVVFLQERNSGRILGAALLPLGSRKDG